MTTRKPAAREPDCEHSLSLDVVTQPASACRFCKDGPRLAKWKADWAAWLAENPDSPEARWVARGPFDPACPCGGTTYHRADYKGVHVAGNVAP